MYFDRQDFLYAIRAARRAPLLTSIVVLALSVGIGLNAGIFTILNFMFLDPPTRTDPASFVQIYPRYEGWFAGTASVSTLDADDYSAIQEQARSLSAVAAWQVIPTTLDDVSRKNSSLLVSCNYFKVFGIDRALQGRFFLPDECSPGTSARMVVISENVWKHLYSSDPHIVGRVIHIDRQPLTVVGVVPDHSANMLPGGVWMPYTLQPVFEHGNSAFHNPGYTWLNVAGRLGAGFTRAHAAAELQTILRRRDRYLEHQIFTLDRRTSVALTDGSFIENPAMRLLVMALMCLIMGPLSLVLLLACTNVTMLFLARSIVRRGETAIRLALGAGRARLARMLALESLLTASAAGLISIVLAVRIPALLIGWMDPVEGQFASSMQPDWKVFGYLAALVLTATFVSALAPIRESFRVDLVTAIKGREGAVTMRSRTTSALIVVQLAMSFVLLTAAVLFARLPGRITNIDPGFETRQTMMVPLEVDIPPYTMASAQTFYRTLESRILAIPGVQSLSYASIAPFDSAQQDEIRLADQKKGQGRAATTDNVSEDFFSTFGIPLLRGRAFTGSDVSRDPGAAVAVVSQAFARAFLGEANAVGRVVVTPDDRRLTVIGVARDTRSEHFGMLDGPRLYTLRKPGSLQGQLFVRFRGAATPISAAIGEVVRTLDSSQVETPSTIRDFLETNAMEMRTLASVILFMAGIAVVLAVTGVYAVLSFAISRRKREFGIQIMLGATRWAIFRSVMTRGLGQIAIGLLGGAALALPAAWIFSGITKRSTIPIRTFDTSVYAVSALILVVISLCAMGLPAFRATQVDPIEALRNE